MRVSRARSVDREWGAEVLRSQKNALSEALGATPGPRSQRPLSGLYALGLAGPERHLAYTPSRKTQCESPEAVLSVLTAP